MSSCLSGGSRAYGFDLEIIKSPSTSTITSQTSSPSSTLSESSNSLLTISTRKARTPRKRPNQTYNEAAALLSAACPNIFSPKHISKPFKFSHPRENFLNNSSAELLLPFRVFDNSGCLIHQPIPEKPNSRIGHWVVNSRDRACQSLGEGNSGENSSGFDNGYLEDFDAESILDDETGEGIDSIMGDLGVENGGSESSSFDELNFASRMCAPVGNTCYGYPMGLGSGGEFGFPRAFRHVDEGEWWRYPAVDVVKISPKLNNKAQIEKKKKKVEKAIEGARCLVPPNPGENPIPKQEEEKEVSTIQRETIPKSNPGLLLKLSFEGVAEAWSDRGSPFADEISGQETSGGDLHARLAQIDLFSENGGVREASVLRYREKRRTRLFSKKIRYQVRKVNADQRPRMKGRFVRRPNSP